MQTILLSRTDKIFKTIKTTFYAKIEHFNVDRILCSMILLYGSSV